MYFVLGLLSYALYLYGFELKVWIVDSFLGLHY